METIYFLQSQESITTQTVKEADENFCTSSIVIPSISPSPASQTKQSSLKKEKVEGMTTTRSVKEPLKGIEATKQYSSQIDILFPESEEEQQTVLRNIEEIVRSSTRSSIDLEFLRDLLQDEHDEEIAFMNLERFTSLDLQMLPWSDVKFSAVKLAKGSTILNFKLTFQKPPENLEDVNVYRLIELFIRTAIENITFIKEVQPSPTASQANKTSSMVFKLKAKYTTIDVELREKILSHVRGTIKEVIGDSNRPLTDQDVEHILKKLNSTTANEEVFRSLQSLYPASARRLVQELSKLSEKDAAKITFEFDSKNQRGRSLKTEEAPSTHWLFPYDFRRLDDLPEQVKIEIMAKQTEILPKNFEFKLMTSLAPVISLEDIDALQTGPLGLSPYYTILRKFSNNGGTIGTLLTALDELKQSTNVSQEDSEKITNYKDQVEKIRDESFESILANIHCPGQLPHVMSMQDFKHMYEDHRQKLKTHALKRFSELESSPGSLKEGDQMWIYHKRPLMRSYAHVVIIGQNQTFFHVAAPEKTLMIRSRARICEGDFRNLRRDDDLCFVVRPGIDSGDQDIKFRQRAEACLDIRFDYDAENCNCETFANAVHGEWGSGLQVIRL